MSKQNEDKWMLHDIYEDGVSSNRVVTRSQTPFSRLRNTPSDLELFADKSLHNPPGKRPLMEVLKGEFGAVPRTMITRSTGKYMDYDEELIKEVNSYKRKGSKDVTKKQGSKEVTKKQGSKEVTKKQGSKEASKKKGSKEASKKQSTSGRKSSKEVSASKKPKDGSKDCMHSMLHDIYEPGVSSNRIVTRSQTAFLRLKNTNSDMDLFADKSRHNPPGKPHLMDVLKGEYGAVPRTIITRSLAKYLDLDEKLIKEVNTYK